MPVTTSLTSNEIEAANRAEATAILIRTGYRVYRPEADVSGEDLVIRALDGELRAAQMKGRPTVDRRRYGGREIWMLFPDPTGAKPGRPWFFVKHDELFAWVKNRHEAAPGWNDAWSYPRVGEELRKFLQPFMLDAARPEAKDANPNGA
ncbi:MAG TPA: hypothetical protein VNE67_06560 [Acetobacteraceae bacterium]|nr:hypothetical protein [Acetobacteraceae bacterium]